MNPRWLAFAASGAIAALDRVTKLWVDSRLDAFDEIVVIPGFFQIVHAENRGMAFSLFADAPASWRVFLLTGVASIVMAAVAWFLWNASAARERTALSLVLGGAAGNLYDRVTRGSVTDFLDFYLGQYHWPTFNVADSAITAGALLLLTGTLLASRATARKVPG